MVNIAFTLLATVLFVNISAAFRDRYFHLSVSRMHTRTAAIFNGRTGETDLECNNNFSVGVLYGLLRSPAQLGPNKKFWFLSRRS